MELDEQLDRLVSDGIDAVAAEDWLALAVVLRDLSELESAVGEVLIGIRRGTSIFHGIAARRQVSGILDFVLTNGPPRVAPLVATEGKMRPSLVRQGVMNVMTRKGAATWTPQEVSRGLAELGIRVKDRNLQSLMRRMADEGLFRRVGRGAYRLAFSLPHNAGAHAGEPEDSLEE